MTEHSHHHEHPRMPASARIAWIVFAVIAAFFLWTEHRAHLLGALPYLFLLACPVMHLFMHHGHGGHHHGDHGAPSDKELPK